MLSKKEFALKKPIIFAALAIFGSQASFGAPFLNGVKIRSLDFENEDIQFSASAPQAIFHDDALEIELSDAVVRCEKENNESITIQSSKIIAKCLLSGNGAAKKAYVNFSKDSPGVTSAVVEAFDIVEGSSHASRQIFKDISLSSNDGFFSFKITREGRLFNLTLDANGFVQTDTKITRIRVDEVKIAKIKVTKLLMFLLEKFVKNPSVKIHNRWITVTEQ